MKTPYRMHSRRTIVGAALSAILAVAIVPRAHAILGMGDVVFVAGDATWIEQAAQWAKQFDAWSQQINEAKRVADFAMTLKDFAGDPKMAVQNLGEVSGIISSLGRTFGDEQTANWLAANVNATDYFTRSGEQLFGNSQRLADTFTVNGKQYRRSTSLYDATMALEGAVTGTRRIIDMNRKTEAEIIKKADDAQKKLANNPNPTESDKQAAQYEMQRLQVMQNGIIARNQSAATDLALKKEQDDLAEKTQYLATVESVKKQSDDDKAQRDAIQAEITNRMSQNLNPVEKQKTEWSSVLIRGNSGGGK